MRESGRNRRRPATDRPLPSTKPQPGSAPMLPMRVTRGPPAAPPRITASARSGGAVKKQLVSSPPASVHWRCTGSAAP